MRVGDTSKAEESFRELISIDQQHEKGLILLGILSMLSDRFAEVRPCLRSSYVFIDST